LQHMQMWRTQ